MPDTTDGGGVGPRVRDAEEGDLNLWFTVDPTIADLFWVTSKTNTSPWSLQLAAVREHNAPSLLERDIPAVASKDLAGVVISSVATFPSAAALFDPERGCTVRALLLLLVGTSHITLLKVLTLPTLALTLSPFDHHCNPKALEVLQYWERELHSSDVALNQLSAQFIRPKLAPLHGACPQLESVPLTHLKAVEELAGSGSLAAFQGRQHIITIDGLAEYAATSKHYAFVLQVGLRHCIAIDFATGHVYDPAHRNGRHLHHKLAYPAHANTAWFRALEKEWMGGIPGCILGARAVPINT